MRHLGKGIKLLLTSTVVSIIGTFLKYVTTQTLPRAGCSTKLSHLARRTLVRVVTENSMTSLTELQSLLAEMGEPARRTKVTTALRQCGLYGRVARQKPLLRKRHITAHLEFAKRNVKD